jgi:DNA-binding PadR family transcriptional regulator
MSMGCCSRDTGRRRRLYALTAKGRRELDQRRGEWRQFAGAMQAILEGGRRRRPAHEYLEALRRELGVRGRYRRRVLAEIEAHIDAVEREQRLGLGFVGPHT